MAQPLAARQRARDAIAPQGFAPYGYAGRETTVIQISSCRVGSRAGGRFSMAATLNILPIKCISIKWTKLTLNHH